MNPFSMKAEQTRYKPVRQVPEKNPLNWFLIDWSNLFPPGAQSRLEAIRTQKNALIEIE